MIGINFRDGIDFVLGCIGTRALWQCSAVKGHTLFKFRRENFAQLQKNQVFIVVAKSVFGLKMQLCLVACLVALQGFFNFGQQVVAAQQELDRLFEFVQHFAQGVF